MNQAVQQELLPEDRARDEMLRLLVATRGAKLTDKEMIELDRMSRGISGKEAARIAGVSHEAIRSKRKIIFRKLAIDSMYEILAELLAMTLNRLGRIPD